MKTYALKLAASAALALAVLGAGAASATTYANSNDGDIIYFGQPDTTSYGQVFVAPGGNLQSWTFYDGDSSSDGSKLVVANWDGSTASGPLFQELTQTVTADGNEWAHTFSNINLALTTGTSYLAYLTVAGVANPTGQVGVEGSNSSPLGGLFIFANTNGADPIADHAGWSGCCWSPPNLRYTAEFSGGGVPEPAAWALMITGFGAAGAMLRRRATVQA